MSLLSGISLEDWLGATSIALALVGIPLTWVLARRSRRTPLLQYGIDFDVLVAPEDGLVNAGLSLKFRGDDIGVVSRTYLALWNRSGDTVDRDHMLKNDPLRIVLGPGDIPLQTRVAYRSRAQNELTTRIEKDEVTVDFEFLDAGDGGIVEVLHQGAKEPALVGTVKGARVQRVGGRLDLTSARIDWMMETNVWSRIRYRITAALSTYSTLRRKVALFVPVALIVLTVVLGVIIGVQELQTPRLVDLRQYNLTTLQGQHDFSARVQDIGQQSQGAAIVLLVLFVQAVGSAYTVAYAMFGGRRTIPRSIVKEKVPPAVTRAEAATGEQLTVVSGASPPS